MSENSHPSKLVLASWPDIKATLNVRLLNVELLISRMPLIWYSEIEELLIIWLWFIPVYPPSANRYCLSLEGPELSFIYAFEK